jgi:two-component system NtrC family sensor kinase
MKISLRAKLIISFFAVITICGLVATLVGMRLIADGIIAQAQDKVKIDLNSAREIYRQKTEDLKDVMRFTASRFFLKDAIKANDIERIAAEFEAIRKAERLDVLNLTDKDGRVIVRPRNPSAVGESRLNDELVSRVLSDRGIVAGTVIIPKEELLKEGADLAEQAHIKFISTPKSKPRSETEETSGMIIKAAAPVIDHDGKLLGVLYGGSLLNRNYEIVDKVKDTVFQGVKYRGKDIGTATIFQSDFRASTNVMATDGSRAIGTRLSAEVSERVLEQGLPWIGRAFVVNNWYIAAYEPITDVAGRIIGVLYVGVLEEKFMDMRDRTIALFVGITLAGMIIALVVSRLLANNILQPIRKLVEASGQWAQGNFNYRVKLKQQDEVARLGETFNLMASSLKERDDKLKQYASQQLMKSERLATLGQLAAGVAHEINNPLGAVLMYTHLTLEDLQPQSPLRKNLAIAIGEASRCRDIVKGLLDFARQTEPKVEQSDINEILDRTLGLLKNQALFQNIKINKVLARSLPTVLVDTGQMQQVFTNIIFNAAEAMNGHGELTIATRQSKDNEHVEIEFTDTGCGISPENQDKIFDPFFTTKEVGKGTGLGLAVSHGIVSKHKGTIEFTSQPGKGSTFTVKLPLNRKEN